jgi:NADH:ubiquinone oxidoreductase subunit 2 (subunit N)
VVAVLGSVVSVAYYLRVARHVWTAGVEERRLLGARGPVAAVVASGVLAVLLGVYPALVFAAGLTGAGPVVVAGR